MGVLYVVATPIGNLSDISQRALQTLKQVDCILCEDTRVSQKMLTRFGIKKPVVSYHQHSKISKINEILGMLKQGKNLALVSDAGTPGISDPGNKLVHEVHQFILNERSELKDKQIKIVPIPGASALTAVASIAGFAMDRFLFLGFPPAKKKRKKFFEEVLSSKYPVIFYESPHRILKTLEELKELGSFETKEPSSFQSPLQVVVGRELTKKFETIYRGSISEVAEKIKSDSVKGSIKGEFAIIVNPRIKREV